MYTTSQQGKDRGRGSMSTHSSQNCPHRRCHSIFSWSPEDSTLPSQSAMVHSPT